MVERSLHETAAADRDLNQFQTLSKNVSDGDILTNIFSTTSIIAPSLLPRARNQMDIAELTEQLKEHPDQPRGLYLLAEAYLKSGKVDEAKSTIAQLDKVSADDSRTMAGAGVLLARYHLYDDAIQHFQAALAGQSGLGRNKFRSCRCVLPQRSLSPRRSMLRCRFQSRAAKTMPTWLCWEISTRIMGDTARCRRNLPQCHQPQSRQRSGLSFACTAPVSREQHRRREADAAEGSGSRPGLGKNSLGPGTCFRSGRKYRRSRRSISSTQWTCLPEWPGSYSTLGVFYFQTGQIAKAKEVLNRFKNSSAKRRAGHKPD